VLTQHRATQRLPAPFRFGANHDEGEKEKTDLTARWVELVPITQPVINRLSAMRVGVAIPD
jgi:hypothetical protein